VKLLGAENDEASAGLADVESRAGVYVLGSFRLNGECDSALFGNPIDQVVASRSNRPRRRRGLGQSLQLGAS
jgi:hypothetical protein